jgi:hypothetical protein
MNREGSVVPGANGWEIVRPPPFYKSSVELRPKPDANVSPIFSKELLRCLRAHDDINADHEDSRNRNH